MKKNGPSGALESHNAEKLKKGEPLTFFKIHSVAKHEKIEENKIFIFGKKSHNAKKTETEGPCGIFQHPFCRKTSKKCRGTLWRKKFRKKACSAEKK